jgi:hypothetical protein
MSAPTTDDLASIPLPTGAVSAFPWQHPEVTVAIKPVSATAARHRRTCDETVYGPPLNTHCTTLGGRPPCGSPPNVADA